MPVPKKKTSKSRRNMRRAHLALDVTQFSICKNCNAPHLSHSVCESCGHYKGRFLDKKLLKADLRVQTP